MKMKDRNNKYDLSLDRQDDAAPSTADKYNAKLLVTAIDPQINNVSFSLPYHSQSFYSFGKNVLFAYQDLHYGIMRLKAIDRA